MQECPNELLPASEFSSWIFDPRPEGVSLITTLWESLGGDSSELGIKCDGGGYAVIRRSMSYGVVIGRKFVDDAVDGHDKDSERHIKKQLERLARLSHKL
jgi:hypothetical protein